MSRKLALSGLQIFKLLPRTNCKDCGFPTCMAKAMHVGNPQSLQLVRGRSLNICSPLSANFLLLSVCLHSYQQETEGARAPSVLRCRITSWDPSQAQDVPPQRGSS